MMIVEQHFEVDFLTMLQLHDDNLGLCIFLYLGKKK